MLATVPTNNALSSIGTRRSSLSPHFVHEEIREQRAITLALLDNEDHHLAAVEAQVRRMKLALSKSPHRDDAYAFAVTSTGTPVSSQHFGLSGDGSKPHTLGRSPDVSPTPQKLSNRERQLVLKQNKLLSPINPTVLDQMADDLSTSTWSSDGEEMFREECEESNATEGEISSPPRPAPVVRPIFDVGTLINSVLGPVEDTASADKSDSAAALVALRHISATLTLDEESDRHAIALEEAEVRTILECYSHRVAVSCTILEHQLLTLLDHIHYHREALLMQFSHYLDAMKREMLNLPPRPILKKPLVNEEHPSHVNRLL